MSYAPIALFVYKRPWHTIQTINSILRCEESKNSDLIIFSDAPKKIEDEEKIKEVRTLIKNLSGFNTIEIVERNVNHGLAKSIISGVSEILSQKKEIIVLEDDMLVSKYFLSYMNQALKLYEDESKVACIHAWNYPLKGDLPQTFFLRGADCWGWATWERAWKIFNSDGSELLNKIKEQKLEYEFDRKGAYPYTQMLEDQIQGKNDSWAIRWHASAFLADMYCLHPGKSLLQNIGLDGSGTHSGTNESLSPILNEKIVDLKKIPIKQNEKVLVKIKKFYNKSNILSKIIFNIKKYKILSKLISIFNKIIINKNITNQHEWFRGNYSSWEEAKKNSIGYDSPIIIEKVKESLLKVKNGEAIYERDSVLFDKIEYSLPLLTFLLYISGSEEGKLEIIDFGGSLGSTLFQNKKFLSNLKELKWFIVEQEKFIEIGKSNFEDETLKFFYSIEDCLKYNSPNAILLSSVLPYIENPYQLLENIIKWNFKYIIIDRTPFIIDEKEDDILTIEIVPSEIYQASYPAYFFNLNKFDKLLSDKYNLIESFPGNDKISLPWIKTEYKALLYQKK
jgi:putative methyltransferase (TIGR04325 family)